MEKKDIEGFAKLLEDVGFENASEFLKNVLIPKAEAEDISLINAAFKYSWEGLDTEKDNTHDLLKIAMSQINKTELGKLELDDPLVIKP